MPVEIAFQSTGLGPITRNSLGTKHVNLMPNVLGLEWAERKLDGEGGGDFLVGVEDGFFADGRGHERDIPQRSPNQEKLGRVSCLTGQNRLSGSITSTEKGMCVGKNTHTSLIRLYPE